MLRGVPGVHLFARGAQVGAGDAVALDQRAVQEQMVHALLPALGKDSVQVRGLFGQDVDAFVQVAVAGGLRNTRIPGQAVHTRAVAEPAQHQHRLPERPQRPRTLRSADLTPATSKQPGEELHDRARDVEHGSIGDQREASG